MIAILRVGLGCGFGVKLSWPLLVLRAGLFTFVIGSDWAVGVFLER